MVASMTSGNVINFGTMTKPFHAGLAARNAVEAAQWAGRGFTANKQAFDGKRAFQNVYNRALRSDMSPLKDLGKTYELEVAGIVIKPQPCGVASHPAIDAALHMREVEGIKPEDVESMRIGVTEYTYDKLAYHKPKTELEAKFSITYPAARMLVDGKLSLWTFSEDAIHDKVVSDLIDRTEMYEDAEIQKNWIPCTCRPCRLIVKTKDGRTLEKLVEISRGNPENQLTREELHAKFRDAAKLSLKDNAIEQAIDMLDTIETLDSVVPLNELLGG
jgi:2-methylcitrate dehydratase PrpD